jgi:PAS domain S-box-containing protein
MDRDKQIENIYSLITELAAGNLSYRASISEEDNELDAITMGINMLAEELQTTTVSKDYLDRIYRGVMDMLFVLDKRNNIEQVNSAVVQMLGFSESELIGKSFQSVFARNDPGSYDRIFRELRRKGVYSNIDRSFKTKKGKIIHVSMSASLLTVDGEQTGGKLFIVKDISKIKNTEQQLRERNEEMNTLIYRASHDLKGPVASIMGLVNLASSETDTNSVFDYMQMITQSAQRLHNVLMEFLELGHITQNNLKYDLVNFEQLIKEICESLAFTDGFRDIRFQIEVVPGIYRSKIPLLRAILHNLIENAVKYRNLEVEKNDINISIHSDGQDITIQVADNGIGMNKRVQENIFKMFFRGTERSEGTGLGMYIVQKSVEALKGKITVKSKSDAGSTITVKIPNRLSKKYLQVR